jgi:alkanesulfonate monooxygenase SsuD/methylene tetrahydromethanopterin reductase-like flavin-dependent oxidoreductase (luciferase family)
MVYVLPLYHPVRLIEEICMLDHLSNGRFEIGIGRGVSPYEMAPWHVSVEEARPIFEEALVALIEGLTTGRIDHEGPSYQLRDVEIVQRPLQQPYPPLWYPTNYSRSVPWIGRHGLHTMFGSLFPSLEATREQFEIYRREWEAHRGEPGVLNGHVAAPCYGISRHIYIAETDAQAQAEAREALAAFDENFYYLWRRHADERIHRASWDELIAQGSVYVGSPATVRETLGKALATCGANYFAGAFAFGSLTPEQSLRSLRLFAEEVLPALR